MENDALFQKQINDIRKIWFIDWQKNVVYTVNEECEKEYQNGRGKCPDCKYRITHRLCVDSIYQNQGIAKNGKGKGFYCLYNGVKTLALRRKL